MKIDYRNAADGIRLGYSGEELDAYVARQCEEEEALYKEASYYLKTAPAEFTVGKVFYEGAFLNNKLNSIVKYKDNPFSLETGEYPAVIIRQARHDLVGALQPSIGSRSQAQLLMKLMA